MIGMIVFVIQKGMPLLMLLMSLPDGHCICDCFRCRAIIHVISGDSPDPVGDFTAINQELQLFSEALAQKPQARRRGN